jgi:hypothetical protein
MNNKDPAPLIAPGFGGLLIDHELDANECFNDGASGWRQAPRLTSRELAMVALMGFITDKTDWAEDVYDEDKAASWRKEAGDLGLTITFDEELISGWSEKEVPLMPLISDKAWDWCIKELRDKAITFKKTGFVRAVDAGSCVCKSDTLVATAFAKELQDSTLPLRDQCGKKFSHDGQLTDLVDPSMFPLIYGKTRVCTDGRQVELDTCINHCDEAISTIAPLYPENRLLSSHEIDRNRERHGRPFDHHSAKPFRWSLRFQWLPCELKFAPDGTNGMEVNSYINNIHPIYHKSVYASIQEIMVTVTSLWNDCIFKGKTGPAPMRIRTYGYEEGIPPEWLEHRFSTMRSFWQNGDPLKSLNFQEYEDFLLKINNFLDFDNHNNDPDINWIPEHLKQEIANRDRNMGRNSDSYDALKYLVSKKVHCLFAAVHPEPGSAFSYNDWKAGKNGKVVIAQTDFQGGDRIPAGTQDPDDGLYKISLEDEFRTQGLQIIIRFQDIDLTPDQPTFAGKLTLEAQRNEHIVATAAYVYSNENTSLPKVSFHQPAWMDENDYDFREFSCADPETISASMRAVFGFSQSEAARQHALENPGSNVHIPGLQSVGSIFLRQNRLITWPNTLLHRFEPFSLLDNQLPGHLRLLLIYLVDPHYRIVSTANVPPQQHDWWADAALDKGVFSRRGAEKIPPEIRQQIDEATEEWPMGTAEARRVKVEVERERAQALEAVREGMPCYSYNYDTFYYSL